MNEEDRLRAIEARISAMEVRNAVDSERLTNIDKKLASIDDGQKWVFRTMLGAFILAATAFVIRGGLLG